MKLRDIKITVLHLRSKNVLTYTSPIKTEHFGTLHHVSHVRQDHSSSFMIVDRQA